MKLQDQVITLDQAKKLKELGIVQDRSYAAWLRNDCQNETEFRVKPVSSPGISHEGYSSPRKYCLEGYSAFTVAELGEMLPDCKQVMGTEISQVHSYRICDAARAIGARRFSVYADYSIPTPENGQVFDRWKTFDADTEAEARAAMLIYLLENNLITAHEINERI